jgi:hypothetical protein
MKGTMQTLTKYETSTLQGCEQVIEEGKRTFVDVGNSLMKIRDGKLYRAEFDTFEDYCQKRWGWTRNYGKRLIHAAEVVENLENVPTGTLPTTERQARPLANLEPEQQREAWQRAQDRAQAEQRAVTADDVTEAVTYTIDPVEAAKPVTESETSNNLHFLNLYWRKASKDDKRAFVEINQASIERHMKEVAK